MSGAIVGPLLLCFLAQDYKPGPDSMRQPGVPQGKVTKYFSITKIYPGTTREFWV
jgi:hypothetical protein